MKRKVLLISTLVLTSVCVAISQQLPKTPQDVPVYFKEQFDKGNVKNLMKLYESNAVFVAQPGSQVGADQIEGIIMQFLSFKLPIESKVRYVYEQDGIAMLITDWSMNGVGPDGKEVHMEGSASDVLRKQKDGSWKYIIDNPFGTFKVPETN